VRFAVESHLETVAARQRRTRAEVQRYVLVREHAIVHAIQMPVAPLALHPHEHRNRIRLREHGFRQLRVSQMAVRARRPLNRGGGRIRRASQINPQRM